MSALSVRAALRQQRWLLQLTKCRPAALATRTESRDREIRTGLRTLTKLARLFCPGVPAMATVEAAREAYAAPSPPRSPRRARPPREARPRVSTFWTSRTPFIPPKGVFSELRV